MEPKHQGPKISSCETAFSLLTSVSGFPKEAQAGSLWWFQGPVIFDDILNIIRRKTWKVTLSGDSLWNKVCFSLYYGEQKMKYFILLSGFTLCILTHLFLSNLNNSNTTLWTQIKILRTILSTAPFIYFTPNSNQMNITKCTHILSAKVHFN